MKLYNFFILCISSLLLLITIPASSQTIQQKILKYYAQVPQEKVYLHTDKCNYLAGDSVWFRGYLMNAITNKMSILSYYLYVDIVNTDSKELVSHYMISCDSVGIFDNCIPLSMKLTTGTYLITAYSNYMRNFGEETFFKKYIRVTGLSPNNEQNSPKIKNQKENSFALSIMPEGGNLIANIFQKIAFKAVDKKGKGVNVNVRIVDDQGKIYCEGKSQHLGMGAVAISAPADTALYMEAFSGKEKIREKLPNAIKKGISISTTQLKGNLLIQPLFSPGIDLSQYALIIHGSMNLAIGENLNGEAFKIPCTNLRRGVTLISLINKTNNEIIAERAVFIRGQKIETVNDIKSDTDNDKLIARKPVKIFIDAPKGSYSLSITDKNSVIIDSLEDDIVSSLLLSSEVKGYVEDPLYYFNNISSEKDMYLDLLMMTQAWRRYSVTDMLNDIKPNAQYAIEQSQIIEGKIGGIWKKNMKTPSLLLMCRDPKITKIINLDKSGQFTIEGLQFADSTQFLISALNHKGTTSYMNLEISEPDIPTHTIGPVPNLFDTEKYTTGTGFKLRKSHLHNMALVELPDLNVIGKKREKPINIYGIMPDETYTADDDELKNSITMSSLLHSLFAKMTTDELGRETFAGTVFVDDFPYERDYVMDLIPQDFERIEYMRPRNVNNDLFADTEGNHQKSVAYGVLIIQLKKGGSNEKTGKNAFATKVITPLGFKQDVEFYSPIYDSTDKVNSATTDIRTTIYWNPKVSIDDSGHTELEFYLPDNPVDMHYDLQGMSADFGPISINK